VFSRATSHWASVPNCWRNAACDKPFLKLDTIYRHDGGTLGFETFNRQNPGYSRLAEGVCQLGKLILNE
jgi:hypothetical protein